MKKLVFILIAVIGFTNAFAQKLEKLAPKIIVIGLGDKNPMFDESKFPHLNFYYTPKLKIDYGVSKSNPLDTATFKLNYKEKNIIYTGEPKFIEIYSQKDDPLQLFVLLDKTGNCYTFGYKLNKDEMGAVECENNVFLLDNLIKVVKKGKVVKKSKKPFVPNKIKSLVGNKPEIFPLQDSNGQLIDFQNILGSKGSLIVFFNLPSDLDIHKISKEEKKELTRQEIQNAKQIQLITERSTDILYKLEKQFFNTKI